MRVVLSLILMLSPAGGLEGWVDREDRLHAAWTAEGAEPHRADSFADSVSIRAEAREAQARFERVRVHHSPWGWGAGGGNCDERVGRFCLRYSSEQEGDPNPPWSPPEEADAVRSARAVLDSILSAAAADLPGDAWIAGQRTWYRGNAGDWDGALAAARDCQSPEPGWCDLLQGYALHHGGRVREAAAYLEQGLAALPPEEQDDWVDLEPLIEADVVQALRRLRGVEREVLEARIWAMGNPLFLVEGNALRTEHLARQVAARIQSDARNPHALRWGDDMTEILVRFGPEIGYERVRETSVGVSMGPAPVSGRFSSNAKGVFPTLEGLLQSGTAAPEAFPPAVYGARSRHAPPGVPRLRALQARTARFVRGDSLLLAAAWRVPDPPAWDSVPALEVETVALFLVAEGDTTAVAFPGSVPAGDRQGVTRGTVPLGRWWASVEALDPAGGRGWRHRQGVSLEPLPPGTLAFSDLVLLAPGGGPESGSREGMEGGEGPEMLEDHLPRMLPTDTLGPERRVEVAWEVYGTPPDPERLRFVIRVEREDRGWARRAGEALRVLSPVEPVEIRWEEGVALPSSPDPARPGAPPAGQPSLPPARSPARPPTVHFRRVELDLGSLNPGVWSIQVGIESGAPATTGDTHSDTAPAAMPTTRTRVVVR